ncbi:hypothetical protein P3T36_001633 [Kitasatospora sp. MAP12-15]|uniref:alkaline shock response membrane anchor protein AmaP n=1 Tax=unclassified Kitasatospora TaxID=2633591 RepID=UPI0024737585|nr:alkaline shock response membrane anchor protein AmaP [Kitasatospora sp. MAP12-44]MDH6113488.1 hypothetical protein [Kitasatospora sp. MAP12-44]
MSRVTVNRVLLGLVGLVLLVVALLVLAGGLNLYRVWHLGQPSWWPLTRPGQPVLSHAARTRWRHREWWWPVVIAVLTLVAAVSFGWLLAQLRRTSPTELALPTPGTPGLTLRVRCSALAAVIATGAEALPEVRRARVRLAGRGSRTQLQAQLLLEPGADVAATVRELQAGPVAQARAVTGGQAPLPLPLELRLRVASPASGRVRQPRHPHRPRVI